MVYDFRGFVLRYNLIIAYYVHKLKGWRIIITLPNLQLHAKILKKLPYQVYEFILYFFFLSNRVLKLKFESFIVKVICFTSTVSVVDYS